MTGALAALGLALASPVAGVLSEHKAGVGDTVEVGAVIASVEEGATDSANLTVCMLCVERCDCRCVYVHADVV